MLSGNLLIVSDSDVNVALYYKGKHSACSSINGDLWRLIFAHLETTSVVLKLFWVPGHLDTSVAKVRTRVPDIHFALNHAADHFADKAARSEELGMHVASGVLYYSRLIAKIQRRFVRVIVSHVLKSEYERRVPLPKPQTPMLCDLVDSTSHNLQIEAKQFRCLDCLGVVSTSSPNLRNWLSAKCLSRPYDDLHELVPVPNWHVIQIKGTCVNSSHQLSSLNGIVICLLCGGFGAQRCKKLALQCEGHPSVAGQRALDRMHAGHTPAPNMRWPRQPKIGPWQPSLQLIPEQPRASHFDDPFYVLPEDEDH